MMSENSFDRYIKNNLRDFKSPVPNGMFEKIMEETTRSKKTVPFWNKKNFKLSVAIFTLLFMFFASFFITSNQHSNQSTIAPLIHPKSVISKAFDSSTIRSAVQTNYAGKNRRDSVEITVNTNHINKAFETSINDDDNKYNNKDDKSNNSPITYPQVSKEKVGSTNKLNKLVLSNPSEKIGILAHIRANSIGSIRNQSDLTNTIDSITSDFSFSNNKEESNWESLGYQHIVSSRKLIEATDLSNNLSPLQSKSTTTISSKDIRKGHWFVEGYGSLDINTKFIQASGLNNDYLRMKDSSHRLTNGYSGGFKIGKTFGDHLVLKIGIQFKQINERFEYTSQNVSKSTTIITTRTFFNNIGQSLSAQDTSYLSQLGYSTKKVNNSYKSLEIPVSIGYEKKYRNFTFGINLGVIANIQSYYRGQTFDTTYQITTLGTKNGAGFYRSHGNLSFYCSAQFLYHLPYHIELFSEPYCRLSIGNSNVSKVGYNHRFNGMGISTGLRFTFPSKSSKN